jgi:hypothetical protein
VKYDAQYALVQNLCTVVIISKADYISFPQNINRYQIYAILLHVTGREPSLHKNYLTKNLKNNKNYECFRENLDEYRISFFLIFNNNSI